jgi:heme o synthase
MSTVADRPLRTVTPEPRPAPVAIGPRAVGRRPVAAVLRAYLALTKPRIVELLLVTTVPAMLLAGHGSPSIGLVAVVLVGGALAAGAANVLNCYLDRDIDQVMGRTARRPLPSHAVTSRAALGFGLVLAVISTALMAGFTNLLATGLTVGAIAYYDLVYTRWLKRRTPLNTVLGGVCGALPVLIGWSAVTGSLAWPAWAMFAVVFLWQPPHFYALALRFRDDYARAGIPMLPVVAPAARVARECVGYTWLTVVASLTLWPLGLGWGYALVAAAVGGLFLAEVHRLAGRIQRNEPARPMRLFHWSTTYLTLVFMAIAVDALIRG